MDEDLRGYRDHLVKAEQKAQEDFDKSVLSLSGGALGISFAFVENFVKAEAMLGSGWLFTAWICWGISIVCVLGSYFASHLALRKAINQVDKGNIRNERVGGWYDRITATLNALGGILFLAGVALLTFFLGKNIGG